MTDEQRYLVEQARELARPLIYEIRVRGRLDAGHWSRWFEGMTVTVEDSGETVLWGPVADQAALYGLLSRLRDLAVPLISVNVRGVEGQPLRRGRLKGLRVSWVLLLFYVLMAGGLSALTVFVTSSGLLHTALALALLFASLGAVAYALLMSGGGRAWRLVAVLGWLGALITFTIYLAVMGWLHPALLAALYAFLGAGALVYALQQRQRRQPRPLAAVVEWEALGSLPQEAPDEAPLEHGEPVLAEQPEARER